MVLLSRAIWRSPCSTWISTPGWLSEAVEKISDLRVGIVVLRSMSSREHAAQGLDAQRQRGHVEQQHVLDLALEHAALDGRADGDDFVRVHALVRGLVRPARARSPPPWACGSCRRPAPARRSCPAAMPASFRQFFTGADGALEQVVAELLHLGAGQLHADVLGPAGVGRDERQVDVVRLARWRARSWPFPPLP